MSSSVPPSGPQPLDENQAIRLVWTQLSWGKKADAIVQELVAQGFPADRAQSIVQTIRVRRNSGIRTRAKRRIVIGVVALLLGIVATSVTYSLAATSAGGGTYIVAFGPILLGGWYLIKGLGDLASISLESRP